MFRFFKILYLKPLAIKLNNSNHLLAYLLIAD